MQIARSVLRPQKNPAEGSHGEAKGKRPKVKCAGFRIIGEIMDS